MKNRILLYFGIFAPLSFWLTTLICGCIIENYNHLTSLVSELGALGTATQYLFTSGLLISAMLNILFIVGLWKVCKKLHLSIIPVVFLSLYSFIAGPALFPMPLEWHSLSGLPFPFLMLSPFIAIWVWRNKENLIKIRTWAIVSFIIMIMGFLIYFPNILNEYFGLKQRFLYTGWSLWSIHLSFRFTSIENTNKQGFNY